MDPEEIVVGRHYRNTTRRYGDTRKVLAIESGIVRYLQLGRMKPGSVKLATFAARMVREVPPGEPVKPYAHVLTIDATTVWHVYKYEWPMEFWYSLDSHAIYGEPPRACEGDERHHFDVRDLPPICREGLQITLCGGHGDHDYAPLEAERRMRAAHVAAIARTLAVGYDIRAIQAEANAVRDGDR